MGVTNRVNKWTKHGSSYGTCLRRLLGVWPTPKWKMNKTGEKWKATANIGSRRSGGVFSFFSFRRPGREGRKEGRMEGRSEGRTEGKKK